ncbi:MAG: hypothetical protein FWE82_02560 [Defluviitaleaceae bacterium]|nr:hypothetical protein [Defluviitaleaceae bacterium]
MSNQLIKCPYCGAEAAAGSDLCDKCGKPLAVSLIYVEAPVAFASGLPDWSIEPPVVAVRRKVRI